MPKKVLVLQHVAHELLGTLNPLLKNAAFRIKYINFGRHPHEKPSLEGYDGLVILGGPMNCDEIDVYPFLAHEVKLIQQAFHQNMPILGICLGAQLMARALGAIVTKNPQKEIGWYPLTLTEAAKKDPLFKVFTSLTHVFQWHGDTFEIPEGATYLASSPLCKNQAFCFNKNAYALQFHLEVDEPMILRWLKVPANEREIEFMGVDINPEKIAHDTKKYIGDLTRVGNLVFKEWIKLFGKSRSVARLPSR